MQNDYDSNLDKKKLSKFDFLDKLNLEELETLLKKMIEGEIQ